MSELSIPLSSDKTESCCLLFTTLKIFLSHLVQIKPGLNASLTANLIMSDFLSHLVQIKPSIQRNNSKNDRLSIPLSSDKTNFKNDYINKVIFFLSHLVQIKLNPQAIEEFELLAFYPT